jgi:hypothetical protein
LTNKNISNDLFIGSKGLRRKIFNNSYISNKLCLPTFPNISALPIKDDILLETSTAPTGKSNYSQLLYGYFKAVYSGNYTLSDLVKFVENNSKNKLEIAHIGKKEDKYLVSTEVKYKLKNVIFIHILVTIY